MAETKKQAGFFSRLGPGLVTGAADDDPSGIATYSQAGAKFGFGMLWTMVLTYPLMCAIQLISAWIGRTTGRGLSVNLMQIMPKGLVTTLMLLLFVANTINIGANLAAMGQAGELATGLNGHALTIGFTAVSLLLQLFMPYERYARFLKWLTLVLFAYVAVVFMVKLDWGEVAHGLVSPAALLLPGGVVMVVAIFGTTISPYLFFWQNAQEVERIEHSDTAHALAEAPDQARAASRRIRLDTFAGMALSNIIALAIMIGAGATLNASGQTEIASAGEAAQALKPVAGDLAFLLFALGIVGTGMLAVPVLAGSAAYAVGGRLDWRCGLHHKPWKAPWFYSVIVASCLLGLAMDWLPIDPIKALFWSAVVNGVIAVPIMAGMMLAGTSAKVMGRFTLNAPARLFGWAATLVMAAAVVGMVAEMVMTGVG